jgi:hypothetical protein
VRQGSTKRRVVAREFKARAQGRAGKIGALPVLAAQIDIDRMALQLGQPVQTQATLRQHQRLGADGRAFQPVSQAHKTQGVAVLARVQRTKALIGQAQRFGQGHTALHAGAPVRHAMNQPIAIGGAAIRQIAVPDPARSQRRVNHMPRAIG